MHWSGWKNRGAERKVLRGDNKLIYCFDSHLFAFRSVGFEIVDCVGIFMPDILGSCLDWIVVIHIPNEQRWPDEIAGAIFDLEDQMELAHGIIWCWVRQPKGCAFCKLLLLLACSSGRRVLSLNKFESGKLWHKIGHFTLVGLSPRLWTSGLVLGIVPVSCTIGLLLYKLMRWGACECTLLKHGLWSHVNRICPFCSVRAASGMLAFDNFLRN